MGEISKCAALRFLVNYVPTLPIALCYRPLDPEFISFVPRNMKVAPAPDAEDALLLTFPPAGNPVELRVSQDRGFLPLQYTVKSPQGITITDIVVEYKEDAHVGWIPSSWQSTFGLASYLPAQSNQVEVTNYALNEDVPQDDFALEFPAATWVNDGIKGESYVIRNNGSHRVIKPGESSRDFDKLMNDAQAKED
ncbi:MAG: hypothetical protein DWQ37_12005 [Planctomycetota bacterium]|nr:MAG: hypothetical protein DWQ37_12005 [Planctomycetota bacterium]